MRSPKRSPTILHLSTRLWSGVADDLRQPIIAVVAVAEHEATIGAVTHNDVPGWTTMDEISQER
jgi:hypothetical protein